MNQRRINSLAAAITLSLVATGAQAAERTDLHKRNIAQLKQQYQAQVAARGGIAAMPVNRHEQFIGAGAQTRLSIKAKREDHGVRNYRYAQTFRGIPVFGEDVVVSEDSAGNVRTLFGNLVSGLEQDVVSVTPRLSKGNALAAGKRAWLGSRLAAMRTENEKSELVIYVDGNGRGHLAYAVSYFADSDVGTPTRPLQIVDANSGSNGLTKTVAGQGTWSVNATTGAITFTPVSGFTGAATPISYTVADTFGQRSSPAAVNVTLGVDPGTNGLGELGVVGEVGVGGDEGEGVLTGIDDDVLVVQDVQELQLRAPPVLRRAEDVPLAPL